MSLLKCGLTAPKITKIGNFLGINLPLKLIYELWLNNQFLNMRSVTNVEF